MSLLGLEAIPGGVLVVLAVLAIRTMYVECQVFQGDREFDRRQMEEDTGAPSEYRLEREERRLNRARKKGKNSKIACRNQAAHIVDTLPNRNLEPQRFRDIKPPQFPYDGKFTIVLDKSSTAVKAANLRSPKFPLYLPGELITGKLFLKETISPTPGDHHPAICGIKICLIGKEIVALRRRPHRAIEKETIDVPIKTSIRLCHQEVMLVDLENGSGLYTPQNGYGWDFKIGIPEVSSPVFEKGREIRRSAKNTSYNKGPQILPGSFPPAKHDLLGNRPHGQQLRYRLDDYSLLTKGGLTYAWGTRGIIQYQLKAKIRIDGSPDYVEAATFIINLAHTKDAKPANVSSNTSVMSSKFLYFRDGKFLGSQLQRDCRPFEAVRKGLHLSLSNIITLAVDLPSSICHDLDIYARPEIGISLLPADPDADVESLPKFYLVSICIHVISVTRISSQGQSVTSSDNYRVWNHDFGEKEVLLKYHEHNKRVFFLASPSHELQMKFNSRGPTFSSHMIHNYYTLWVNLGITSGNGVTKYVRFLKDLTMYSKRYDSPSEVAQGLESTLAYFMNME